MGVFDKEPVVVKELERIPYVNSKNKQEETVIKGSRAEKILKKGKQWSVKKAPAKV